MSETLTLTAHPARDAHASLVHSLVAQSPALIAIRGNDGTYLYANESFAQLLNLPAESLPGRHEDDVLHTAGVPRALGGRSIIGCPSVPGVATLGMQTVLLSCCAPQT